MRWLRARLSPAHEGAVFVVVCLLLTGSAVVIVEALVPPAHPLAGREPAYTPPSPPPEEVTDWEATVDRAAAVLAEWRGEGP